MRKERFVVLLIIALALVVAVPTLWAREIDFRAELTGEEEVVDGMTGVVVTGADGEFRVSAHDDDGALEFELKVEDLENATMAHIHLGPAGENGPVVVWLYPDGPPPVEIPGEFDGVLAEGTITQEDLMGPLQGMTLDDLLAEIEAGNAYVNVHTTQHPDGEIRGQLEEN